MTYLRAASSTSAGPAGRRRRVLHRNPAAAAQLRQPPLPARSVQRLRPGRPVPHGAGRAADRRPVRQRAAHVQGAAARGVHRAFYETDPGKPYTRGASRSRASPAADHVRRTRRRPRLLGRRLREYMRDYIHWATLGALCEFLPAAGQPGHPRGQDRPYGLPVASSATPNATTTAADERRESVDGGHPARRRGDRGGHHRPVRAPGRRGPDAPRPEDGVVDATQRTSPYPTSTSPTAASLPTQGAANPALTIMALAARVADHLTGAPGAGGDTPPKSRVRRRPPATVRSPPHTRNRAPGRCTG